jgi:hypothetical protein
MFMLIKLRNQDNNDEFFAHHYYLFSSYIIVFGSNRSRKVVPPVRFGSIREKSLDWELMQRRLVDRFK